MRLCTSLGVLLLVGCQGVVAEIGGALDELPGMEPVIGADPTITPAEIAAAGEENTFDHPSSLGGQAVTARDALRRISEQGPPGYSARVHGCRKLRYETLGTLLSSLGVDMEATEPTSAGAMWREADQALGGPNYGGRIPEQTEMTVAISSRMFDIFVQAAPEIIFAMPTLEHCTVGARGAVLFDTTGCNADGISCLIGAPSTPAYVALCNDIVDRAAVAVDGQSIAVAAMLAAAHTCE